MNELTNINTYLLIIINNPLYHYIPADFQYEYAADANIGYKYLDLYDAVYKDLPKKHHVLKKKVKNYQFCHAKRFLGEGPAFCCKELADILTSTVVGYHTFLFLWHVAFFIGQEG